VKSAGKPGNGSLKPDGTRLQALYEPRKMNRCGHLDNPAKQGKPTLWNVRKAAVLISIRLEIRTPPGSETRACSQRGSSGTRETRMFPYAKRSGGYRPKRRNSKLGVIGFR
jgi:hypothetical protein